VADPLLDPYIILYGFDTADAARMYAL
jgi:hypothetical protein